MPAHSASQSRRQEDEQHLRVERVAAQSRGERNRTFGTKKDREGIETRRVAEQVDVDRVHDLDARSDQTAIEIEVFRARFVDGEQCFEREALNLLFVHFIGRISGKYNEFAEYDLSKGWKSNQSANLTDTAAFSGGS